MRISMIVLTFFAVPATASNTLQIGDGRIDAAGLKSYDLRWRQCAVQDGAWISSNDLLESFDAIGDGVVRVQQRSRRKDGTSTVSTSYFDRHSFAPLRMEHRVFSADGTAQGTAQYVLNDTGYQGRHSLGDKSKNVAGSVSSKMLHGGAMGLPLALLDYQAEPLKFPASMINFDASYQVTATWAGKETLRFEGAEIDAWLVDVEWLHEGTGDVYPPGPDASGGRYWIVNDPPPGFPYVPRYQTDTYAVEFMPGVCPEADEK
jgi:hypothetical protein